MQEGILCFLFYSSDFCVNVATHIICGKPWEVKTEATWWAASCHMHVLNSLFGIDGPSTKVMNLSVLLWIHGF